ncbi:MAG TPA: flagellar biosynthesis anti-sigma factor FlgM [Dongiaceae bacterium]|nr:flagellar biosynthesis anti-sigma factor FlgM [Dongiaceae bacterium]
MKIDPKVQSPGQLQSDALQGAKKAATRPTTANAESHSPVSGDTIQISSRHAEVHQMTAQAAELPEVRAEKVAPLKASVAQHAYHPDSGKVADAMIAEHSAKSAKG